MLASTRSRMVAAYLVLLVVAGAVAVVGIRQVLIVRLDSRTRAALRQEVSEVRTFVEDGRDPATGRPFARLEQAFDVYMDRNVPSPEEAFVTYLEGELHRDRLRSFPGRALPGDAEAGWVDLSAGGGAPAAPDPAAASPGAAAGPSRSPGSARSPTAEAEAQDRAPLEVTGTFNTGHGRATYHAVRFERGGQTGAFVVAILPAAGRREIQELQTWGAAVMVAVVLAAAVCAWFLAGRVLAPVRELTATARSISESERTARLPVTGRGSGRSETAEMATTFNAMLDRLDDAYQGQIEFVRSAGHELRAPLTVASGHLELLGDDEEERRTIVPLVLDELSRMGRMVDDLQSLVEATGPDFLRLEPVDAELLAHELVAKATALGDRAWRLDAAAPGTFVADKDRLTEAVLNLADNAVHHTGVGDVIAVGVAVDEGRDEVALWVRDEGPGVAPDVADRLFERFERGRDAARRYRGSGLGLAIVRSIAEAHGGHASLALTDAENDTSAGTGARFTITLPRDPEVLR